MKSDVNQFPLPLPESNWTTPAIPDLSAAREVAIDTETRDGGLNDGLGPGWATGNGHLCGVSVAWNGCSVYLPIEHPDSQIHDRGFILNFLEALYARHDLKLVFMNAQYDLGWIWHEFGLLPPSELGRIDDVGAMAVMVDENRSSGGYSLDGICQWQGLPGKDEMMLREAGAAYGFGGKALKQNIWRLPARFVGPYAEADAAQTLAVTGKLRVAMEQEGTTNAYQTEADLIGCCFEMRRRGIRVNTSAVGQSIVTLRERRDEVLDEISKRLCRRVTLNDIRSSKWMEVTCADEGIEVPRTQPTKDHDGQTRGGGRPSFRAAWMRKSEHWLPRMACTIDRLSEAADKFLGGYILGYEHRGRIHPTINQFRSEEGGTRSHRFSYADPPLQQAPGKKLEETDELGAEVATLFRGAFLPEEGELWCSPDYNSQEYRLIVHYAEVSRSNRQRRVEDESSWENQFACVSEAGLSRASEAGDRYRNDPDTDFHQLVADMTGLSRRNAKAVNFAKAYGAGVMKFALMTGMALNDARDTMEQYDEQMPFVREEAELCRRLASSRGYIRLIDGALSHFNLWEQHSKSWSRPFPLAEARAAYLDQPLRRASTHKAMNRLIQGSAARQMKIAMLNMWREGIVPLMTVHDEVAVSCDGPERGERTAEIMRDAVKLTIPVKVDVGYGTSWVTARKIKGVYDASWDEAKRLSREGKWW
jgi:DNA polymerase I-like protein with 3'-5' exonuclease and polymerase domains